MVVVNAKLTKKRGAVLVVIIAVILVGVILIAGRCGRGGGAENEARSLRAETNDERVEFLLSHGWSVEPRCIEFQAVTIPTEFGEVYDSYNRLQTEQGFDLKKYAGCEATRYTYKITNYPGENVTAVADIIVYRGTVIAGDVQSPSIKGFMTGIIKK